MARSFYRFQCVCGKEVESEETTGTCACGLLFDVSAWGQDPVVVKGDGL